MGGVPPPFTRMSPRPEQGVSSANGTSWRKLNTSLLRCFDVIHSHKANFIFTLSQY
jgi:hypothetical protein